VFINKGKGNFEWMPSDKTNLKVDGEVRDILQVKTNAADMLLFLRNDDYPKMFRVNAK
jgi:hypothetical protein